MTKAKSIAAAFIVAVNAIVLGINGIASTGWTDVQVGLIMVLATTSTALVLAIYNHMLPATKREPVAIGAAVIAESAAITALLSGFQVWHLTDAQNGLLVGIVVAVVGLVTTAFVREQVTAPVAPPTEANPGPTVNPEGQGE